MFSFHQIDIPVGEDGLSHSSAKMSQVLETIDTWITRLASEANDDVEDLVAKKILVTCILVTIILLIPNTIYLASLRLSLWVGGSVVFIMVHILLLVLFLIWRKGAGWIAFSMQLFYILFSFFMVMTSGGILHSGGTIFIGLIGSLVFSLVLPYKKHVLFIFGLYLSSVLIEAGFQPMLTQDAYMTPSLNLRFFLMHFLVSYTVIFFVLKYYIDKQRRIQEQEQNMLYAVMPAPVVRELLETGKVKPVRHEEASVLFTDFEGFTNIVASMPAKKLIEELNSIFYQFDHIILTPGIVEHSYSWRQISSETLNPLKAIMTDTDLTTCKMSWNTLLYPTQMVVSNVIFTSGNIC